MTGDIRYRAYPQTPGQIIDAVGMDKLGLIPTLAERNDALCSSEGMDRYGQWGVYIVRELPENTPPVPEFPMQVWDVNIHVGAGHVGTDNQVSDRVDKTIFGGFTQQLIGFQNRGLAVAVSGDQVRVSMRWQPSLPGARITTVDNVKAWIAPGAPQHYRVPFQAVANQFPPVIGEVTPALRIPTFAQSMRFTKTVSSPWPVWVAFAMWRDQVIGGVGVQDSATQLVPMNGEVGIPPQARYVTFIDSQGTPPPAVFADLSKVWGYFDCWG